MKKLNKLVLNQIAKKELTQRQQGFIKGGMDKRCTCGCCYAGEGGGSSVSDNLNANCDLPTSTMCSNIAGYCY